MRWKILPTPLGFLLVLDGEPIMESNDINMLLSFYGELTGQNELARAC